MVVLKVLPRDVIVILRCFCIGLQSYFHSPYEHHILQIQLSTKDQKTGWVLAPFQFWLNWNVAQISLENKIFSTVNPRITTKNSLNNFLYTYPITN